MRSIRISVNLLDRKNRHRHAALCLATVVLIVGRLLDWRNRWSPS
jgi:hypothetical protein